METKLITRVNNVDIVSTSDEQMVPIRPICEALGINYDIQRQKLQEDEDLASFVKVIMITDADGNIEETTCLPLEFIFGWLFTINPEDTDPKDMKGIRKLMKTCYKALYNYVVGGKAKAEELNKLEASIIERRNEIAKQLEDYEIKTAELEQRDDELDKQLKQFYAERLGNKVPWFG